MKPCRACKQLFEPTPYQLRKCDYRCLACRRRGDSEWRKQRKLNGNPVSGGKASKEWWREYENKRNNDPAHKAYRAAAMKRYAHDPRLRHKFEARWLTHRAVKAGKLIKQPCEQCGSIKVQAHHKDYSKPLDVMWLCVICHRHIHAQAEGRQL